MPSQLRLLAVHAHPDDESSKGAATSAKYAAQGARVMVATCTGGERGDVLNPTYQPQNLNAEQMAQVRRKEMAAAATALGIEHRWLGYVDSGLPEGYPQAPLPQGCFGLLDVAAAARPLIALIREFRPQVMTTYDPNGGYPHPDHIMCHKISVYAYEQAGKDVFSELGQPHQVSKLYYNHDFSLIKIKRIHEALLEAGMDSPFGDWISSREISLVPQRQATTRIEVAEFFAQRDAALLAHATQIDPQGFFFAVPRDFEAEVWPFEEFELADAKVATEFVETDLFAGID